MIGLDANIFTIRGASLVVFLFIYIEEDIEEEVIIF